MAENSNPSWVSYLYKSMSMWFIRCTYHGWMFVLSKYHPFDYKYHTIACGKSGILYAIEIVEGKDHPKELPDYPTNVTVNTNGILLHLTKVILINQKGSGVGHRILYYTGSCRASKDSIICLYSHKKATLLA